MDVPRRSSPGAQDEQRTGGESAQHPEQSVWRSVEHDPHDLSPRRAQIRAESRQPILLRATMKCEIPKHRNGVCSSQSTVACSKGPTVARRWATLSRPGKMCVSTSEVSGGASKSRVI